MRDERDKIWEMRWLMMRDERWLMKNGRWEMIDEKWEMIDEWWEMRYEMRNERYPRGFDVRIYECCLVCTQSEIFSKNTRNRVGSNICIIGIEDRPWLRRTTKIPSKPRRIVQNECAIRKLKQSRLVHDGDKFNFGLYGDLSDFDDLSEEKPMIFKWLSSHICSKPLYID